MNDWRVGLILFVCVCVCFVEQDKVDVVKMTMQDNIQQMLANEERLDQISENAENLNEQVCRSEGIFRAFSTGTS